MLDIPVGFDHSRSRLDGISHAKSIAKFGIFGAWNGQFIIHSECDIAAEAFGEIDNSIRTST
jgi:hypothetical protein